jgi:hypothetical protein
MQLLWVTMLRVVNKGTQCVTVLRSGSEVRLTSSLNDRGMQTLLVCCSYYQTPTNMRQYWRLLDIDNYRQSYWG